MNRLKNQVFQAFICFQKKLKKFWRYEGVKNKIRIWQLLYIVKNQNLKFFTQESKIIYEKKSIKRSHAFKTYAQTYILETLHSFNPEIQLKNTKCAIVKKRLKNLLNELRGFKFVTAFAAEFKKQRMIKRSVAFSHQTQMLK